jgi:hypothetical protein
MVELIDGRHDDSIQHGQKDGPCACTQGWVANGVCVEKSPAAELRVFAQTTHTYYKPACISDRFFRRLQEAYHFPRTEHRAAPRLCHSGSTVEALSTYAVAEFHLRIVRKKDWMSRRSMGEWVNPAVWTSNR